MLCTARKGDPRAPLAIPQALCTAPLSVHTALAHEATHRSTHKIDGVRSNYTRPALGAPLRDKHCGDSSHTARQRRPEHVHNKEDTSSTSCGASQSNTRPARANAFWYATLVFLSDSSKPGTNKSVSELLRLKNACPSDATSAHTFLPESEERPTESMVQSALLSSFHNLDPLPQRSPQPLCVHLSSSAVALVCCHCEAVHPWEARNHPSCCAVPREDRSNS